MLQSIPHSAVEPIISKYVEFWFGRNQHDTIRALRQNNNKEPPLIEAVRREDESSVFILLYLNWWINQTKTKSNSKEFLPRGGVCHDENNNMKINERSCVDDDDSNDITTDFINVQDQQGWTSLHWATALGNESICRLLLERRANVNIHTFATHSLSLRDTCKVEDEDNGGWNTSENFGRRDNCSRGSTPLHLAIQHGHSSIAKLLLPHVSLDTLLSAMREGYHECDLEIVQLLVDRLPSFHCRWVDDHHHSCSCQCQAVRCHNIRLSLGWSAITLACKGNGRTNTKKPLSNQYKYGKRKRTSMVESLILDLLQRGADYHLPRVFVAFPSYGDAHDGEYIYSGQGGMTLLHVSIIQGLESVITWLLQQRDNNVNEPNEQGWTCLHLAVDYLRRKAISPYTSKEQLEFCWVLIEMLVVNYGADVNAINKSGRTALHLACDWSLLDSIPWTEASHSINIDKIHCQEQTFLPIVKLLLEYGVKKEGSVSETCCKQVIYEQAAISPTPLYLAIKSRKFVVQRMTETQDKGDDFASPGIVQLLLSRLGRRANANAPNKDGLTPLHLAAVNGDAVAAELLLQYFGSAINIHAIDRQGATPLWYAVRSSSLQTVKVLLDYGAAEDINRKNRLGITPMHCVMAHGSNKLIDLLVRYDST